MLRDIVPPLRQRSSEPAMPPLLFESINGDGTDYHLIKSPAAIIRKLQEISRHRQQLKLHLFRDGEVAGVFHSSIQKVNATNKDVILHQLVPANWRALVSDEHPVTVSCYLPSGHVVFDTLISPLEADHHNPFCLISFPDSVHVQQLRSAFRVALLPNTGSVELRIGRHLITGLCLDMSFNGCCVKFPAALDELLKDVEPPASGWLMRFYYDGSEIFQTHAGICRVQADVPGYLTAGLKFSGHDAERNRRMQALLLTLQRERIRQQPLLD